jgi:hypothetical protein
VSPDKKLLAVVGDDRDALLVDSRNGKVLFLLIISGFFGLLIWAFVAFTHNLLLLRPFFRCVNIVKFFIKKIIDIVTSIVHDLFSKRSSVQ